MGQENREWAVFHVKHRPLCKEKTRKQKADCSSNILRFFKGGWQEVFVRKATAGIFVFGKEDADMASMREPCLGIALIVWTCWVVGHMPCVRLWLSTPWDGCSVLGICSFHSKWWQNPYRILCGNWQIQTLSNSFRIVGRKSNKADIGCLFYTVCKKSCRCGNQMLLKCSLSACVERICQVNVSRET